MFGMAELTRVRLEMQSGASDANPAHAIVDGAVPIRTAEGARVASDFDGGRVQALRVDGFRDGLRDIAAHELNAVGSANEREWAIHSEGELAAVRCGVSDAQSRAV